MKYGKRDSNHASIVKALRQVGALVMDLGDVGNGKPDLVVQYRGSIFLLEVKNRLTSYGKAGLNEMQQRLANQGWLIHIVHTAEAAWEAIGAKLSMVTK